MKLLTFNSYKEYVDAQTKRNKNKINQIAASTKELEWIDDYLKSKGYKVTEGICHGVRNGFEVKILRDLTRANVVGTEISETANKFENVIQWDFHEIKPEWIGHFDFVYSNSWDHSFAPDTMMKNWMKSLSENGRCFLQWTNTHAESTVSGADCFGLSIDEMIEWLDKNYQVETIHWLYEHSIWNPKRYLINLLRHPRPGIRGRKIAVVVVRNK